MRPDQDQESLTAWTDAALAVAVVDESATVDRREALSELILRAPPELGVTLRRLIENTAAASELRRSAAVALGRRVNADAQTSLVHALFDRDDDLVRHAAASLGRIGNKKALKALRKATADKGSVARRSISFARSLIAYRLGLPGERLERPSSSRIVKLKRDDAIPIKQIDVPDDAFSKAATDLARELPALSISPRGSFRLTCMGEKLWVVFPKQMAKHGTRRMSKSSVVAAAILKLSTCPEHWYLHEYVLTHPAEDGVIEVHGVRPSGRRVHYGHASIRGNSASLTLHALNLAGVPALEMSLELFRAKGAVKIRRALVSNHRRDDESGGLVLHQF